MRWDRMGSQWHRWDMHVHTPESYEHKYGNRQETSTWVRFVESLISAAKKHNISAVCLQDYFTFDGYAHLIRHGYYDRVQRTISNLKTGAKRQEAKLLILPGVELRLSVFADKTAINLHLILDESFSPEFLQQEVLDKIHIDSDLTLSKHDLVKYGFSRQKEMEARSINYDHIPGPDRDALLLYWFSEKWSPV